MMKRLHWAWLFAAAFAALSIVLLGAFVRVATAGAPVVSATGQGGVPLCSATLDAALPYHVREPVNVPAGLVAGRCDITATPGDTFARRTQYYTAADKGWVSITIAPKGAEVSLVRATSTQQVAVGTATATLGVVPVGSQSIAAMYWNDGDVAVVLNAGLSPAVTVDKLVELARSLRQR